MEMSRLPEVERQRDSPLDQTNHKFVQRLDTKRRTSTDFLTSLFHLSVEQDSHEISA